MKTISITSFPISEILISQNDGKWKVHVTYLAKDAGGKTIYQQRTEFVIDLTIEKDLQNLISLITNKVKDNEEKQ